MQSDNVELRAQTFSSKTLNLVDRFCFLHYPTQDSPQGQFGWHYTPREQGRLRTRTLRSFSSSAALRREAAIGREGTARIPCFVTPEVAL